MPRAIRTARTTLTNKGNAGDRIACGVITK
jgi:Cu/Zn superoxide dismutase